MLISLALAASAQSSGVALDLLKILAAAALVAVLLRRFRLPLIPCYLITGALIGPGALGLVESGENISFITCLAIVMLLFTIGLHLDPSSIGSGVVRSLAFMASIPVLAKVMGDAVAAAPVGDAAQAWPSRGIRRYE